MENRQISINVGGQVFYTSTRVLRTIPNSLLADLCDPTVTLEQAMEFSDKGFRHGTPHKDLKTYDTSPDAPWAGFGVKNDKSQSSPTRSALKEKLSRANFIYISCNSGIRHLRRKPARTNTTYVSTTSSTSSTSSSSSSSSSSSPPPARSSSSPNESPHVPRPDLSEASPTTTLSWSTSPSYPPPYLAAKLLPTPLPLYYPVTNAISMQEERLVFTEQPISDNHFNHSQKTATAHILADDTKPEKLTEQNHQHHRKLSKKDSGGKTAPIDKYPLLDMNPNPGLNHPSFPDEAMVYIEPGHVNGGFHSIYEDSGLSDSNSPDHGYNFFPLDSGGYKTKSPPCDIHDHFRFFRRAHSYHPNGRHNSEPSHNVDNTRDDIFISHAEQSPPKTQSDKYTSNYHLHQEYQTTNSNHQYDHHQHQYQNNHNHHHQHLNQNDQQHHHHHHQHHQQQQHQQHLFKIYQEPSLVSFPFPPACHADIYVDRNPSLMPFILDAYRIGQLHLPSNICSLNVRAELDFWKLPEDLICECCWMNYHQGLKTMGVVNTICKAFYSLYDDPRARAALSWPGKIWLALDRPSYSWFSKVWCGIYFFCIVLSCIQFGLLTVEDFNIPKDEFKEQVNAFYSGNYTFRAIHMVTFSKSVDGLAVMEVLVSMFFTVELVVRLVTCPSKREFLQDVHNIIDIFIVTVQWSRFIMDRIVTNDAENFTYAKSYVVVVFYCLLSCRVLRVFHLAKRLSTLRIMYLSTKESSKELFLLVVTLAAGVLLFGTALFLVEAMSLSETSRLVFANIPAAMWWAVITLTTVGYGDYVPEHAAGYLVGSICAIAGLLLVAMPIAIVASNFSSFHDNMTSRDQSIRRGLIMAKIKHLRTENSRRSLMGAGKLKKAKHKSIGAGPLAQEVLKMSNGEKTGELVETKGSHSQFDPKRTRKGEDAIKRENGRFYELGEGGKTGEELKEDKAKNKEPVEIQGASDTQNFSSEIISKNPLNRNSIAGHTNTEICEQHKRESHEDKELKQGKGRQFTSKHDSHCSLPSVETTEHEIKTSGIKGRDKEKSEDRKKEEKSISKPSRGRIKKKEKVKVVRVKPAQTTIL